MTGPGDPPEGTPEGAPGGGEDEYRSVVFDESFVRAARLQEFSAQERMGDHAPAVRSRHAWSRFGGSRQALILVLLIALAFGTAIYMGVRHPYRAPDPTPAPPLRSTVIPLAPVGTVPGGRPADLFERSPAAGFRIGAAGVNLPVVRRTGEFSESQVMNALTTAKEYVVRSSLDPDTLAGGPARGVRLLLDTTQLVQFDRSLERPSDDGRHAATGWLVRFDPSQVRLADPRVRVDGTLGVEPAAGGNALEVTADYTFVYAVRPPDDRTSAGGAGNTAPASTGNAAPAASKDTAQGGTAHAADRRDDGASLFTVRRELHFRFDRDDLRDRRLEVQSSYLQAGPMSCNSGPESALRPLLAGERAGNGRPEGTDPYAHGSTNASLCGVLAPSAEPSPLD
ncbi:hypothetical protein C3486_20085 [Streptomyces sp. Ru73]|uniref:SCO2583 family membrane protein n=1 Tax=Streptomyces sp. Ru73 TaxID=2080748 RepID=UPI000CDDD179|nr:hypothetical protein [Streptomyces sp. Ru73]POX39069.1 hypothetical protein C3486_20085 [Streptomyces sp. Ru73]